VKASQRIEQDEPVSYAALAIGECHYAIRAMELDAVVPLLALARVPSSNDVFLGIGAPRGRLVAIFDPRGVLGCATPDRSSRWLALVRGHGAVALAFTDLDGFLAVNAGELRRSANDDALAPHSLQYFTHGPVSRRVLSLPSLLAALRAQRTPLRSVRP